jgi:hypothetical protein
MKSLLEIGKWLDDDKDYQISTEKEYNEFVKKRNYKFSSDGDALGFDRVKSIEVDNSTQIVVKSKKPIKANEDSFVAERLAA